MDILRIAKKGKYL